MGKTSRKITGQTRRAQSKHLSASLTDQNEVARLLAVKNRQADKSIRIAGKARIEKLFNQLGPIDDTLDEVRQGADS